jgi:rhodanese-related sulfurtransferase
MSVSWSWASEDASAFPLRAAYPDVPFISMEDLAAEYDDVIIVDVRSNFEYDVVSIAKAVHIPIALESFLFDLENLRAKDSFKKFVFYCNGTTCPKSYDAVQRAQENGFKQCYVYDTGIFEWIKAYPERGVLMGETPVPQEKIISEERFQAKMIDDFDVFLLKAREENSLAIDIRDPIQRDVIPDIPFLRNIPLDRLLPLLKAGELKDKRLLLHDNVGKQVRWLQYYLEHYGYEQYFFLEKGAINPTIGNRVKESLNKESSLYFLKELSQ